MEEQPIQPQEFAEPVQRPGFFRRVLPPLITMGAFFGLALLGWYAYQESMKSPAEDDLPLIESESETFKKAPEDPGGEQIPYRDKEVYSVIANTDRVPQVVDETPADAPVMTPEGMQEEAMPQEAPVEAPVETPSEVVNEAVEMPAEPIKQTEPAASPVQEAPTTKTPAEKVKAPTKAEPVKAISKPAEKVAEKPVQKPLQKTAEKPAEKVTVSGYRIQLGAYRSAAEVAAAWSSKQKKYREELGSLKLHTERADLGAKGIFYRLQAFPVDNQDDAKQLCKKLRDKKQECFVVKPAS